MIDRERVMRLFAALGAALSRPTTLCLIGSTPGIMLGQSARQTEDIDVWHPASRYDAGDLARACEAGGVRFDPKGEIERGTAYLQIVRPGIVSLPEIADPEIISIFGGLTLTMPPPSLIAAAKLTRGSETDLEDVAWWVRERALEPGDITASIDGLPRASDRETAAENMVLVRLLACGDRR